jgi:hypothetical protein
MDHKATTCDPVENVRELLRSGQPEQALARVERCGQSGEWMKNARGVCLMRMGRIDAALETLRDLVFRGLVCIPSDVPGLYKANYATVLLMKGYTQQAMEIIRGLDPQEHPYIARLNEAIAEWKRGLNLFQRFLCLITCYPSRPVELKFGPGDI